jgi:hypothetical protein
MRPVLPRHRSTAAGQFVHGDQVGSLRAASVESFGLGRADSSAHFVGPRSMLAACEACRAGGRGVGKRAVEPVVDAPCRFLLVGISLVDGVGHLVDDEIPGRVRAESSCAFADDRQGTMSGSPRYARPTLRALRFPACSWLIASGTRLQYSPRNSVSRLAPATMAAASRCRPLTARLVCRCSQSRRGMASRAACWLVAAMSGQVRSMTSLRADLRVRIRLIRSGHGRNASVAGQTYGHAFLTIQNLPGGGCRFSDTVPAEVMASMQPRRGRWRGQ